jgi:hypothetical protein
MIRKITSLTLALFIAQFAMAQNLNNDLYAYFKFSNNYNDEQSNVSLGTAGGSPSPTIDRFLNANSAYSFGVLSPDPEDDLFAFTSMISGANDFGALNTDSVSINLWFKDPSITQSEGLIELETPGSIIQAGTRTDLSLILQSGTVLKALIKFSEQPGGPGLCQESFELTDTLSSNFDDDQWHMLSLVKSGDSLALFFDGSFVGGLAYNPTCIPSFSDFNGVNIGVGDLRQYEGELDDIMLYSRALTAADITALYNLNSSTITSIDQRSKENSSFEVFPNPTNNQLSLQLNQLGDYQITVIDMNGRVIYQRQLTYSNQLTLNSSEWAAGLYAIQVRTADGYLMTQKVVKQ